MITKTVHLTHPQLLKLSSLIDCFLNGNSTEKNGNSNNLYRITIANFGAVKAKKVDGRDVT
jgi:hypothetical protein